MLSAASCGRVAGPGPLAPRRPSQRLATCRAAAGQGSGGHAEAPASIPLPGGALWWQNLHTGGLQPVYGPAAGETFVLQRRKVGGPGLVRSPRQPPPMRAAPPAPAAPPMVWLAPAGGTGLTLAGVGGLGAGSVVIDTEFEVLTQPRIQPNTTCVGIVWQPSAEGQDEQEASASASRRRRRGKHPRRTQMLRFTCNLCGASSDCEVNPHAWSRGSVFARCSGCTAVHKLRDNLKIFHELRDVFPPRELRSSYLVQEILDKIVEKNNN